MQADALREALYGRLAHSRRAGSCFSVVSAGSADRADKPRDSAEQDEEAQNELRHTLQLLTMMRQDSENAEQYIRSPDFGRSRAASVDGPVPQMEGFAPTDTAAEQVAAADAGQPASEPEGVGPFRRFRMVRSADRNSGVEGRPLFELQQEGTGDGAKAATSVKASTEQPAPSVHATQLTAKGLKVPVSALQAAAAGGGEVDQVAHLNRALLSNAAAMLQQGAGSNPAMRMLLQHTNNSDSSDTESD